MKVKVGEKTLTFPEGTSLEDIESAVEEYSASLQPASQAYQPELQQEVSTPQGQQMPHGMDPNAIQARNSNIQQANAYEQSLVGDKEAQRMKEIAEGRGTLGGIIEGAKNVGKQFYAGTIQSPDWMPDSLQDILDYRVGGDNTLSREEVKAEKDAEMATHNKQYRADRISSPVATTVGEMIPYLATGTIGEKALINLGKGIAPVLKNANIKGNKMIGNLDEASRLEKIVAPKKDLFNQNLDAMLRGTATGAGEGALMDDATALTSAASAMTGGVAGILSPLKILDKVPGEGGAGHKAMIKELHREGFHLTPGLVSKNRVLQTQEAGMRNSDNLNQTVYNKIDEPNLARLSDMAGEAIGLNTKGDPMIQQSQLKAHMDSLSGEYQDLERRTAGSFNKNSFQDMGGILKRMQPTSTRNKSPLDKSRYAVVEGIFKDLQSGMKRGEKGDAVFSGTTYQNITRKISDEMAKAVKDGDKVLQRNLRDMKKQMDAGIKRGMGEVDAKHWDDLHDKYAMSKLLMEGGGLTASGKVNPAGLTKSLMNKAEAERTLTGTGGRITKLQDMVRYSDFLGDVEGGFVDWFRFGR